MKREFSAGGIVFRKNQGNLEFLLIQNDSIKDRGINYWGFPKGHLNQGESSQDAAIREVKEETDVEVKIVAKIGESRYVYTRDGEKVFKFVILFLMEYLSGEIKYQKEELLDAVWTPSDQVLEKLSFPNDKALFKKALEMIKDFSN